ncbi:hypothetical protein EDB84DRAFT_1451964, partial [Lactarius hengduanensis]
TQTMFRRCLITFSMIAGLPIRLCSVKTSRLRRFHGSHPVVSGRRPTHTSPLHTSLILSCAANSCLTGPSYLMVSRWERN